MIDKYWEDNEFIPVASQWRGPVVSCLLAGPGNLPSFAYGFCPRQLCTQKALAMAVSIVMMNLRTEAHLFLSIVGKI